MYRFPAQQRSSSVVSQQVAVQVLSGFPVSELNTVAAVERRLAHHLMGCAPAQPEFDELQAQVVSAMFAIAHSRPVS